jgi:hypothetical protein
MTNLFKELKASIYNPVFYRRLLNRRLSVSLSYYFKLSLLLTLFLTIAFAVRTVPAMTDFFWSVKDQAVEIYPNDLVINIKSGQLTANVESPYFITMPTEIKFENSPANFLVIDTSSEAIQDVWRYDTLFLLTDRELIGINKEDSSTTAKSFSQFPDTQITKVWLAEKLTILQRFLKWIIPAIVLMFFVAIFSFIFIGGLLLFVFSSLILMLIGKLIKVFINYSQAYKFSLHASTLGLIIAGLSFVVGINYSPIYIVGLLTIIIGIANLLAIKNQETEPLL